MRCASTIPDVPDVTAAVALYESAFGLEPGDPNGTLVELGEPVGGA